MQKLSVKWLFNTFRRTLVTFRICEWLRLPQEVNAIQDYVVGAEAKSSWLGYEANNLEHGMLTGKTLQMV